jgi:hypothetical protein
MDVLVVLHPLTISRTDLAENPSPLPVVWLDLPLLAARGQDPSVC